MTSVEKRHSGHRKHRKHSDGAHSDTSSGGSFLDETDREVSSLTDRAFRSLCIGDEAVYNDSDLGGTSSPSVQREKQLAFSQQSTHGGWDTEALKREAHERFSLRVQQYGEDRMQGGPYGAQTQGEGYGEARTERGVSATFQRSFVDMSQQEDSQGDEQLSLLNGPMELGSQHRRSRSRVSSLIKAFSNEGYRDANLREWNTNEASWDKSALMSIQRELSEFSDACHQNFNSSGPFSPPGSFSTRDNNFYSSEMATAVAHMDATSSFMRTSHSTHSAFNTNSKFFIHSEFSPFRLWRDHNRFPFQHGEVTGFMPRSEFPRWYETPMYKELSLGPQPPGPGMYTERGPRPQRKPVAPPPPPRSTSTSSVMQKATALEKRSESELTGQYPPWKQIQGSQSTNRLASQRPSTVSPTGDLSRRVRDTLSSVSKLQQKISMMTSAQSVTVEMTARQQGMLNSYDTLIPFSTVERNVAGSAASSTTPFNISQLLTPVIPAYQGTETLDAMSPHSVEHPPVRAESRGATPDIRSSYKSRATSLLFNLKDNRKRVKSTYSPPKFKGPEMADKSKQHIEPRDTIIDMPDFPDPVIQIPQVLVQEEPGMTDAALHQALQEQCSRVPPPAAYTSPPMTAFSGLDTEYNAREYLTAQMQGEMVPHGGFSGFPQGNYNSNQLINGLNRQEDLSPFTAFKMGQIDKREPQAGIVYGQASSEKLGVYNTLPIATSPLTKHNISPKPFYSTTDTARSNIDSNSQNRGYVIAKTSTEKNASKSIFTNVDGYEQVTENRYGYNAVSYQDSCKQQAYVSTTSSQAAESLQGVEDKPRPAWKGEIAAYLSEKDKQAQSSQSAQEQSWNDGASYQAPFHAPYQPLAGHNISNQLQQYTPLGNEPVLKDQSEPYSNRDPGTAKAKYEHHRAQQNEGHETKDNYPIQNYYPYGKMEQEYRKQQMFYSEDTKNTVMQETAQKTPYVPKLEENEALRLQQNYFKPQRDEHDKQRPLPSSAEGRQCNENVLTMTNQIKADHTETEPPKTLHAEGTGGVQVGRPSPGSSGAELIIGQPGGERHEAKDMKAERAMGVQVKTEDYNLEHVVEKQAEEGASEGQTGHVEDKLEKAAPDETENKQEQSKSDNREIQQLIQQLNSELATAQQTQQSGLKQAEDRQADRESIVAENRYEVKEIEQSEAEQVEISQVTVEQAKVEQIKEELCGKIKTEHMEQAKEDKTRGELIEAGQLNTNTEQTQTEHAKAQLARAELSKIEKMKSEPAKSKAKQADTEQVKLEPTKVQHAKTELAKARAELAKIKEKMRGEQKDHIEEGNVANKSTPEKFETAENLKYQQNEDLTVNSSDPVTADRDGDDYEHVREKYGWMNTDDSQKPPLVDDKVVEAMNNKESKDETNPERIPIDSIGQEQSLSSTEYDEEVRENQYVYSESSKEFKLSSANNLLTDGNTTNNNDTFKAKDDQAMNDNSEKREPLDHNISLSKSAKSLPHERKPSKDPHSTPYRALSYKERAQARQEILTSKIKAHAEKEISAIKEKGLSKNPTKHLVSGQGGHVRQKPPPLETPKGHDKVSNKEQSKVNKVDSSQAETVMREGCILETQTTNKAEGESEAIPEDSAPSLKLVLGQSETTTADDDLQIMGIRVTVRERKPSVSDGQVDKDAHEAAKSKISHETQPLLFKQGIITRKAKDYTNGTSLPVEKRQDSAPSEESLYDENNSMTGKENIHISIGKQDIRTNSGEHSQGEDKLHIDGIAIRVVPGVIEKQEMTENHPAIKIPSSSVGAVNENKPAALPSPGTKTNTSKDEDRAQIVTPGSNELKPIKDSLEPRHTSPSERQGTHSLRLGDEHNADITTRENKQVKTPEKPTTVEATAHARMDEDYFQLQGATETNHREVNLSLNVGNMSNAESGNKMAESTAENDTTVHSKRMHREVKDEQASKQGDGPTQRQSKFSARMKTDEDVHARKHDTESQSHSSATERQPANNTMQENVNYKQKPKEKASTTPEISAIADYARLKVIAAEGSPDTLQDFHPGKKEGFFPLIQSRPSRRPVFTTSETQGLSAKEKTLPKEPEVSAKVSQKEPKAVVFSIVEQEHKRTGMFRLGDKENKLPDVKPSEGSADAERQTHKQDLNHSSKPAPEHLQNAGGREFKGTDAQGANQGGHHPMPASTSAPHPRAIQGQTHTFGSSGGAQREEETRVKQKEEEQAAKVEEERREKLRQERLAAQREEEEVKAKRREAERKAAEERRAKQIREEELRMKRMLEERKAAEVEEAKKAAQREEERRAKERQAIAVRLEEERRAKQREMERRAEEEKKAKQREMERKAEEEKKAKQREMERRAEEEKKAKKKEMERKAEEERKAKKREMEKKAEEERREKQREMEKKAEEEKKAKQREMERKAEEERKTKKREMERKAEEERKTKQREMEKKAEEERRAKEREMERKAEEERKAKQREMERKVEEERRAKEREAMAAKREQERRAKQRELERREAEERRAKQAVEEMRRKQIEEERRVAQREEERRAKEREAVAARIEEERRERQRETERRAEEEKRAKEIEEQQRAKQREEEERRAAQIEEERKERERKEEMIAAQREEERRRAAQIAEEERKERERKEEERRAAQLAEERRIKQMEERKEREKKEEMIAAQREEERRRRAAQQEEEEERKERERKEEKMAAQREEERRRAAQLAEERRIKQMEEEREAAQIEEERKERQRKEEKMAAQREEERRRAAQLEEEEEDRRRAAQMEEERKERQRMAARREEGERRRAAQREEEEERRRASQLEEERKERQRKEERMAAHREEERRRAAQQEEEEERSRAAQLGEEERSRASQLEEEKKERQRMAARREEGERRRASQLEEERKERQRKEERMVAQIQEERRRAAQIEEEESNAKEREEQGAKEIEEKERQAMREKERRAGQREDRREKRHAAQRMDPLLQYYDTAEGDSRPPRSPVPSRRRGEPSGVESAEDAGSYSRPHATPSPAPSASRSNASSPAFGAKPTMFKVKDNTVRGGSFSRSVKPRFHKNLGEDFRVGSPLDGWRGGSQAAEDEQDKARRGAGTPVQHDGFAVSSRFSLARETSSVQDHSAPPLEHRPYSRRSIALDEEDSRSMVSNMSEDMESFATSAADLAELRGIYDYDRPESACSFSSDVSRSLGKPPSVPAKTDKALRRAKRLTQRRIKKELSKTAVESPAPEEKPLHADSGVPSATTQLHSSSSDDFPILSSPHFSAPISLTHAPTQDPSAPPSRPSSRTFHASPHHSPPVSLPMASPHHSPPVSLPRASPHHSPPVSLAAAPQSVPRSPTLHHAGRPAPVTQYQVEPGYSQNHPVTQRKVLQDPGSGQYYVVDMPVQVKAKTFFDPETGKYVQLNVRQTAQGGSPQPRRKQQQAQPQQPARPQAAPTGYPSHPQHHHQSSLPTHRSSSGMSATSTLPEDSAPARQSQTDGNRENERGRDSHELNCSPEQTRYMDTACEPGKTPRTTAYNTHNTEQATRSQPRTNNTAVPRDIITMSELEDFMDDW